MAKGKKGRSKRRRKGSRGAKKGAAKKKRKSAKRAAAARKAARTRARKKAARAAAGRKGARRRKSRKGGRRRAREMAMEPKRRRKKGKRKSRKGGRRRTDLATQLSRTKASIATIEKRYSDKRDAMLTAMGKASQAERARLLKRIEKLEREKHNELIRLQKAGARRQSDYERLQAAERGGRRRRRRKGRKGKGRRRHHARRNPIGSSSGMEHLAAGAGVVTGVLLTVLPYRFLRTHALTAATAGGSGAIDAPAQGDVPNLLASPLPVWSRLKWKGLAAVGTVIALDVGLPFLAAAYSDSPGWKTFFQMWGYTAVTLGSAKVVLDVAAIATKKTLIGQRLFASENTARDVRAQSAAAALPAISVAPGLGLPGLTGYGKPPERQVGAGCSCGCGGATGGCKKSAGSPPANTTVQPPPAQPITAPTPVSSVGAQGSRDNVVRPAKFAGGRFGGSRYGS